ncbi:hypothetical protein DUI87_28785 [Hirundo rustica rustica]|uniref:PX domain-containing protein n=1 Tax=Hirundo rustica rustica TaxID=333673 RepID=A0A3M0JJ32_HIRRU|nr:hypothetical protein DUI87_28785 [Hirundo rustica rustica]
MGTTRDRPGNRNNRDQGRSQDGEKPGLTWNRGQTGNGNKRNRGNRDREKRGTGNGVPGTSPEFPEQSRIPRGLHTKELTTVRVQDPRVHNEGSWNSYVDYKIFLHTNSRAFTAKTSCVRRRYREFAWLRRQLQKNAGLVPVPELPGKSGFFVGSTDEFIERRRQGLQRFLERVLQSAVLLSDSRLHLFLQSQLPVAAIEACVRGRAPLSVTEAIVRHARGQRGDGAGRGGAGSAQGCLESFSHWSDFGMAEAPECPEGPGVTPLESPEFPAGHRVTPLESPEEPQGVQPDTE